MRDDEDIEPVEITCKAEPSWWDFEITLTRLVVALAVAVLLGASLAMLRIGL